MPTGGARFVADTAYRRNVFHELGHCFDLAHGQLGTTNVGETPFTFDGYVSVGVLQVCVDRGGTSVTCGCASLGPQPHLSRRATRIRSWARGTHATTRFRIGYWAGEFRAVGRSVSWVSSHRTRSQSSEANVPATSAELVGPHHASTCLTHGALELPPACAGHRSQPLASFPITSMPVGTR